MSANVGIISLQHNFSDNVRMVRYINALIRYFLVFDLNDEISAIEETVDQKY